MKDFYPLAQQEEIAILDVRESYEYEMGHVPKAKNVPLSQLANEMKTLDPEKSITSFANQERAQKTRAAC